MKILDHDASYWQQLWDFWVEGNPFDGELIKNIGLVVEDLKNEKEVAMSEAADLLELFLLQEHFSDIAERLRKNGLPVSRVCLRDEKYLVFLYRKIESTEGDRIVGAILDSGYYPISHTFVGYSWFVVTSDKEECTHILGDRND